MTTQQILEKAIQKAIDGGWNYQKMFNDIPLRSEEFVPWLISSPHSKEKYIFNHQFAKALWGEKPSGQVNVNPNINAEHFRKLGVQTWQVHLQQMVIADDPIKYLGENIPNTNNVYKGRDWSSTDDMWDEK